MQHFHGNLVFACLYLVERYVFVIMWTHPNHEVQIASPFCTSCEIVLCVTLRLSTRMGQLFVVTIKITPQRNIKPLFHSLSTLSISAELVWLFPFYFQRSWLVSANRIISDWLGSVHNQLRKLRRLLFDRRWYSLLVFSLAQDIIRPGKLLDNNSIKCKLRRVANWLALSFSIALADN